MSLYAAAVPTHLFSSVTSLAHHCKNTEPSHPLAAPFSYDCVISGSFSQILSPSVFSSGRLRWCMWTTHNKIRWNNACSLNDELYTWNLHFIDGETETQQREWEVFKGETLENSKSRQGHSLSSLHGVSHGQQCAGMVTRIYVCLYIYFLLLLAWDKHVKVIFFITLLGSHYTLELTSSALRFCCCLVKNTQLYTIWIIPTDLALSDGGFWRYEEGLRLICTLATFPLLIKILPGLRFACAISMLWKFKK